MRWLPALLFYLSLFPGRVSASLVTITVGSGGNYFSPANFTINPGDTVRWRWTAGYHNTSGISVPAGAVSWYANITNTDTSFSYIAMVSGLYTYTCTHHSGMDGRFFVSGCSFPAKPVITAVNSNTGCKGDTILLTTSAQTGATYQWIKDGVAVAGAAGDSLPVVASGVYKVLVNRCGADSVSGSYNITVHPLPVVSFTATNTAGVYSFTNMTAALSDHHFIWIFDDGSPPQTSVHASHIFAAPGNRTVVLKAIHATTGCADTAVRIIEVDLGITGIYKQDYALYPNPAHAFITVTARYLPAAATLEITDVTGRQLMIRKLIAAETIIPIADLNPGLYQVRIITGEGAQLVRKLMVY